MAYTPFKSMKLERLSYVQQNTIGFELLKIGRKVTPGEPNRVNIAYQSIHVCGVGPPGTFFASHGIGHQQHLVHTITHKKVQGRLTLDPSA